MVEQEFPTIVIDLLIEFLAKTSSSAVALPCSIVYAGLEPIEFIDLFPKWTVHLKARQQNLSVSSSLSLLDWLDDLLVLFL